MSKEFKDYSSMFGLIDDWSPKKLKSELKRYQDKLNELNKKKSTIVMNCGVLSRNIVGFKRREREFKQIEIEKEFILKKDHLLMLKNDISNNSGFDDMCDVFGYNISDMSENQQNTLVDVFDRLLTELPLAIKHIANETLNNYENK